MPVVGETGAQGSAGGSGRTGAKGQKGQRGNYGPTGPPGGSSGSGEDEKLAEKSDERLKAVQGNIANAVAKVKQMEAYYFYSNELADDFGYDRVAEGEQKPRRIGLIAQELAAIEPDLVELLDHLPTDEGQDGYYTINYNHLNALLIEAMKELEVRAAIAETQAGL